MTDDSATLRAKRIAELWCELHLPYDGRRAEEPIRSLAKEIESALLASQSSWAKEKAELERQRDEERRDAARYCGEVSEMADEVAFWKFQAMWYRAIQTNRDINRPKDWHAIEAEFEKLRAEELAERHASRPISEKD